MRSVMILDWNSWKCVNEKLYYVICNIWYIMCYMYCVCFYRWEGLLLDKWLCVNFVWDWCERWFGVIFYYICMCLSVYELYYVLES